MRRKAPLGAVTGAGDQDQGANLNGQNASIEHHVGRAEDFDVEAVGVVPPVIERRGGEHGGATPGGNEGAQGPAEFPYADAGGCQLRIPAEGAGKNQVAAGESRQDAA